MQLFAGYRPPFRCCEAVLAEACFLMRTVHKDGPAEVMALGRKGVFDVALLVGDHWAAIEALLRKYASVPMSLADASLIRCAEIHEEPRILTFDPDFGTYRWARTRRCLLPSLSR